MKFQPEDVYALLSPGGAIRQLDGGGEFWSQPEDMLNSLGRDWLVSEFTCDGDWASWEMHPNGDEFVYLLNGDIEFLLELPDGVRAQRIEGRGTWHTAKVFQPSRMFFITLGAGTEHRPA